MKTKNKYAIVLLCILSLSVLLLSLSYAKNSELGIKSTKDTLEKEEFQVVCSSSCYQIKTNEEIVLALTNKKKEERKIALSIPAIEQNKEVTLYINGQEQENPSVPFIIDLFPYGQTGDFKNVTLEIKSEKEAEYNIKINNYVEENTLEKAIKNSASVYKNGENYYYYGENPSNYIRFEESIYQIIGLIDNKLKIISPVLGLSTYKEEFAYPELEDYLKTFKEENIPLNEILSYKSWMTGEKGFWLKEEESNLAYYASKYDGVEKSVKYVDLYTREVIELNKNTILLSGNGSKENPYEVEYERK